MDTNNNIFDTIWFGVILLLIFLLIVKIAKMLSGSRENWYNYGRGRGWWRRRPYWQRRRFYDEDYYPPYWWN